jgi:hypothetical protein
VRRRSQVVCVDSEEELLLAWRQFLVEVNNSRAAFNDWAACSVWLMVCLQSDPDILLGYNSFQFDLPYMM